MDSSNSDFESNKMSYSDSYSEDLDDESMADLLFQDAVKALKIKCEISEAVKNEIVKQAANAVKAKIEYSQSFIEVLLSFTKNYNLSQDQILLQIMEHGKRLLNNMKFYQYADGRKFHGELEAAMPNGLGKQLSTKEKWNFWGTMANSKAEGFGVQIYTKGDYDAYEGNWTNDYEDGYGIQYKQVDDPITKAKIKQVYKGQWKNGLKCGHGTLTQSNGFVYEGEFLDSKQHGYGKLIQKDGHIIEGCWNRGEFTEEIWCSGELKVDRKNGNGAIRYYNGELFVGTLKNEFENASGAYFYPSGSLFYGNWVDKEKKGAGQLYYANGDRYNGCFNCNLFSGFGVFESDSEVYQGYFKNGVKSGKGKVTYAFGDAYEGEWKEGEMDGRGEYVYLSGSKEEREYNMGERVE